MYIFYIYILYQLNAEIAQLVEQWIEDPRVTSSNLVPGIINIYFRKASLVQLVERRSPKSGVEGSSPSRRVKVLGGLKKYLYD